MPLPIGPQGRGDRFDPTCTPGYSQAFRGNFLIFFYLFFLMCLCFLFPAGIVKGKSLYYWRSGALDWIEEGSSLNSYLLDLEVRR